MKIIYPEIPLDNVLGILIDLDHTLYDFMTAEEHALKKCHEKHCQDFQPLEWQEFLSRFYMARMSNTLRLAPQAAARSRYLAFQLWLEETNIPNAHILAADYEDTYWDNFMQYVTLAPDAEKFLEAVQAQNIPITVVTNMQPRIQLAKLQKMGIAEQIDFMVTSEEAGAEKPSPHPFRLALEKMQLEAKDVIMVGDNSEHDIKGAEALGIKSYLVKVKH
ncbi:MAG: HAD family hydrolase [Alphaproteobacteria bacterium]|nr:HAD family hydrolase [Alphaproteobacteria bacterium]